MTTRIKSFDPSRLHHKEARAFHEMVAELTRACHHELVVSARAIYVAKLEAFCEALTANTGSLRTAEIKAHDILRIRLFVRFRAFVRVQADHFIPLYASIAQAVYDIVRKYGRIDRTNRMERSGCLKDLLEDLYAYDNAAPDQEPGQEFNRLSVIGAKVWVEEIERVNNLFLEGFMKRLEEQSGVVGLTLTARKELDGAGIEMLRKINALIELYGDEGMTEMVARINELIDYQTTFLKIRHSKGTVPDESDSPEGKEF